MQAWRRLALPGLLFEANTFVAIKFVVYPQSAVLVVEATRAMTARESLSAFTVLWCAQQALLLFYTQLASPFEKVQALLVAAATLSSAWPPALCAALAARIYANVACWPKFARQG